MNTIDPNNSRPNIVRVLVCTIILTCASMGAWAQRAYEQLPGETYDLVYLNDYWPWTPTLYHYVSPNYPTFNCCPAPSGVQRFELELNFNTGEDHVLAVGGGDPTQNNEVKVQVEGITSGTSIFSYEYTLKINSNGAPESKVIVDLTEEYSQCKHFYVRLLHFDGILPLEPYHSSSKFSITPRFWKKISPAINEVDYKTVASSISSPGGQRLRFNWDHGFHSYSTELFYPAYEFQLLRLYNTDVANQYDEESITTDVDWSNALSVLVLGQTRHLDLLLTEGRGFYVWRVRPVAHWSDGGYQNPNNWGAWSYHGAFQDGATGEPMDKGTQQSVPGWWDVNGLSGEVYAFYYDQFDIGLNWSHTMIFSEGNDDDQGVPVRFGERMTFANGLQQITQEQAFQGSLGRPVVSQTVYDYAGRPALKSMPFPLTAQGSMGFTPDLLRPAGASIPYEAAHFDTDDKFRDNDQVDESSPSEYYSGTVNDEVPLSGGYPFTRVLFYPDGRPKQTSGPGTVFAFDDIAISPPTSTTYYGGATKTELARLFGLEAYDPMSVHKVVTMDPNGVSNIAFQDKEGKTLATCMGYYGGTAMDPLPSQATGEFEMTDEVQLLTPVNDYTNEKTIELVYMPGDDNTIDVTYDLDPDEVLACYINCITCDYTIEFFAYNKEYPTVNLVDDPDEGPHTWPGDLSCPIADYSYDFILTIPVNDFGTYVIGRRIRVNNQTGPPPADLVMTGHLATVNANYDNIFNNDLDLDTWLVDLQNPDLTFDHQAVLDALYLLYPPDANDTCHIPFDGPGGACGEITFPYVECVPCSVNTDTLLNELLRQYNARPENTSAQLSTLLNGTAFVSALDEFFDYPECGHPTVNTYTPAMFAALIENMIDEGYDCETMIACWQNAVGMYLNAFYDPLPPIDPNDIENAGAWTGGTLPAVEIHLVDIFLDCVGRRIIDEASDDEGPPGYLTNAFSHIYTGPTSNYDECLALLVGTTVGGESFVPDLTHLYEVDGVDDPETSGWQILFNCMNSYSGPGVAPGTYLPDQLDISEQACYQACYAHVNEFYDEFLEVHPDMDPTDGVNDAADAAAIECARSVYFFDCMVRCNELEVVGNGIGPQSAIDHYMAVTIGNLELHEDPCPQGAYAAEDLPDYVSLPPDVLVLDLLDPNDEMPELAEHLNETLNNILPFLENYTTYPGYFHMGWTSPDSVHFTWQSTDPSFMFCELDIKASLMLDASVAPDPSHVENGELLLSHIGDYPADQIAIRSMVITLNGTSVVFAFVHGDVDAGGDDDASLALMQQARDHGFGSFTDVEGFFVTNGGLDFQNATYNDVNNTVSQGLFADDANCLLGILPNSVLLIGHNYTTNCDIFPVMTSWQNMYENVYICSKKRECSFPVCYSYNSVPPEPTNVQTFSFLDCGMINSQNIADHIQISMATVRAQALADFEAAYMTTCAAPDNVDDSMTVTRSVVQHHYTLYYYDRAGNLMATVPPRGVDPLEIDAVSNGGPLFSVDEILDPSNDVFPDNVMRSSYKFNSLGNVMAQSTPDGGLTKMVYDRLGRVRFSQNDKQVALSTPSYSYTRYDLLGRVTEVGQSTANYNLLFSDVDFQESSAANMAFPPFGDNKTITKYTTAYAGLTFLDGGTQRYLQNRVSYAYSDRDGANATLDDRVHTFYSYDPHGNVEWLIQDIPGLGRNYVSYEYDLISGRVLKVHYNQGRADEFHHRYTYDEDGRIVLTETSRDQVIWDRDASYDYYTHGPLRRIGVGEDHVQGLDHAYTLQGWLKGINDPMLEQNDEGQDGYGPGTNPTIGTDAFGMRLAYFNGDFTASGSVFDDTDMLPATDGLYNGNIAAWSSRSRTMPGEYTDPFPLGDPPQVYNEADRLAYFAGKDGRAFRYDALNRLLRGTWERYDGSTWASQTDDSFKEELTYDPNGNIMTVTRHAFKHLGMPSNVMDELEYNGEDPLNNRLDQVEDQVSAPFDVDLGWQPLDNYEYDQVGQLTRDSLAGITDITWTPYGKVERVIYLDGHELRFGYDAMGNRVWKILEPDPGAESPTENESTYYVRDAQGNIMATYRQTETDQDLPEGAYYKTVTELAEEPIYGSSRVGLDTRDIVVNEEMYYGSYTEDVLPGLYYKHANHQLDMAVKYDPGHASPDGTIFPGHTVEGFNTAWNDAGIISQNNFRAKGLDTRCMHRAESLEGATLFTVHIVQQPAGNPDDVRFEDAFGDLMWWDCPITPEAFEYNRAVSSALVPGTEDQYYVFSIGSDGKPYAHIVDMGDHSPTEGVVKSMHPLFEESDGFNYGQALAVVDDRTTYGSGMLYLKRYSLFQCHLIAIDLEQLALNDNEFDPSMVISLDIFSSGDKAGLGEMQVSADGHWLAVAYREITPGLGVYNIGDGRIRVYNLNVTHDDVDLHGVIERDGNNVHSLDFSPGCHYLYWTENGKQVSKFQLGVTKRVALNDMGTILSVAARGGDVRHANDGQMITIGNYGEEVYLVPSPDNASITPTGPHYPNIGTGRLLAHMALQPLIITNDVPVKQRVLGDKHYELTDHLGNVRVVVSDLKEADWSGSELSEYRPVVESRSDYYAFGQLMPGRNASSETYRFGFNGKENDNEVHASTGNSVDFGARMYDPRVGRWMSTDPYASAYPSHSPYVMVGNSPIIFYDANGKYFVDANGNPVRVTVKKGVVTTTFDPGTSEEVKQQFEQKVMPFLHAMAATKTGQRAIRTMDDIETQIKVEPDDASGTEHYSDIYPEHDAVSGDIIFIPDFQQRDVYKAVTIKPHMGTIREGAALQSCDVEEIMGAVMTVEAGHLEPDQLDKDNPEPGKGKPEVFQRLYNRFIDFRFEYREAKGQKVTKQVFENRSGEAVHLNKKNEERKAAAAP